MKGTKTHDRDLRDQEVEAGGDGPDVHAGVDRVGGQQEEDDGVEQWRGVVLTQHAGQAAARYQTHLGANWTAAISGNVTHAVQSVA